MPLSPEERKKRLQTVDEIIGQNFDEQIKEHKASAKVSLAIHFERELTAAEECAKNRDLQEAFVHRIWAEMLNTTLNMLEKE
ncbi:MAG TPA: hypothetical protein VH500_22970 [Nitrososphaeraceae archaeon]|jgi:hypothetical protein